LQALALYYEREWPTLSKHLDGFDGWARSIIDANSMESGREFVSCQAMLQYYKTLSFSLAGWGLASDEASSLVFGFYGGELYPKLPIQVKTYEGQGLSLLARNGLDLTKNRGGFLSLTAVKNRPEYSSEQFAEKALEVQPNSPRVRATWSILLAERGDCTEALRQADAAVTLCPKSSTYLANRAYVKNLCGYPFAEINKDWESSLALRKNNPLVFHDRAMFRLANQSAELAMEDLDNAIQQNIPVPADTYRNPAVAWSLNARGEILKAAGEKEKALEDFKLAAGLGPKGPWTQAVSYKAAVTLAEAGRIADAVPFFQGAQDDYFQDKQAGNKARIALSSAEKGIWPPKAETEKFTDEEIMLGTAAGALLLFFYADADAQVRAETAMRGGLNTDDMAALAMIGDDQERERERLRRSRDADRRYRTWLSQRQAQSQTQFQQRMRAPMTFRRR
jgi:tetratricopeptide (TPR) repeat protein